MLMLFNYHLVAYPVGVWRAFSIFSLIVVANDALASCLKVLPIGFEPDIVNRIAIEH